VRQVVCFAVLVMLFISSLLVMGWADAPTTSPDPPIAGQPFTVNTTDPGTVTIYTGANLCSATTVVTSAPAPNPSFTLSAGGYHVIDGFGDCLGFNVIPAPSIPEYPIGLPILAILMILGYTTIKRRTLTKKSG